MLGYIGVTDHEWFQFLASEPPLEEVNFYRPRDTRTPRQLVPGTPFMFKLKVGHGDRIVGFGVVARHDVLPLWLAWDALGRKNGAPTLDSWRRQVGRVLKLPVDGPGAATEHNIGCIMLSEPVWFRREDWVAPPAKWPPEAVQGKGYDLSAGEGARVWEACKAAAAASPNMAAAAGGGLLAASPRYGAAVPVAPRLGQGTFRLAVTSAYSRSCTVTGEHSLPALEAAHIKPYGDGGEHEVSNGLLLRSDIHRLFDTGYVGVTPDYKFVVSDRLRGDYSNGRSYYPLNGQPIALPARREDWPKAEALAWHAGSVLKR